MIRALLLFSGGLDSLLAGLFLREQGIEIIAVRFVTPFFGWKLTENPQAFQDKMQELGFAQGIIVDVTAEYLEVLKKPKHGYGSLANPCIDCKIFLIRRAKEMLRDLACEFLVTGEVLGERPLSQNKRALEVIEAESGAKGLLLRPLSAKLLPKTEPEKRGLVDRGRLLEIQGRRRTVQLKLAETFGLKEIPTPAGGCLLTDPVIGARTLSILKKNLPLTPDTAQFLVCGRHYLEDNFWLVLGRNEAENEKILLRARDKFPLFTLSEPAPLGTVLWGDPPEEKLCEILLSRSKKAKKVLAQGKRVDLLRVSP